MKDKNFLKHKKVITWILIIPVFLFMLFFYISKQNYQEKLEKLNHCVSVFNCYTAIYDDYFSENFCYPKNMDEVENFSNKVNNPLYKFTDPFSKHSKNLLYIPLYNKNNNLCEGYMLLSAGIDGKINATVEDTVFMDDIKRFKLYNPNQIKWNETQDIYEFADDFSLYNYFCGKKDLLIGYKDGVKSFILNATSMGIYSPSEVYLKYSKLLENNVVLNCAIKARIVENNEKYIILSDDEFNVHCSMYVGRPHIDLKKDSTIIIVGKCNKKIETDTNIIYMDKCIVVEH